MRADGKTAVWVVDKARTVSLRNIELGSADANTVQVASGLKPGDVVVTAGVQALRPGQKVRLLGGPLVIGPNLSEWALKKRSLVVFLMIVARGRRRAVVPAAWAAARTRPSPSAR